MTGGVLLTASLIPVIMIFINRRISLSSPRELGSRIKRRRVYWHSIEGGAQELIGMKLSAWNDENAQF